MKNETFTVRFVSEALDSPEYIGPFYSEKEAYNYADKCNNYLAAAGIPSSVASYGVCDSWVMKYKELLSQLQQLDEYQLNQNVAVYDEGVDEYYQLKVELVFATDAQDVLDINHPVIRF